MTESFRNLVFRACAGVALGAVPFMALTARAQSAPKLERVEVALWPEYDKPSVLVILRAWLPVDAALPTSVAFRVPASTGVPHATAKRAADGTLLMAPFNREVEGDVATITIATDQREVRLEYYMPLESSTNRRAFSFEWLGGPEIAQLAYDVQQPAAATDLLVTPASSQQGTAPDGLVYHRAELGRLPAGEGKMIRVEYTKATGEPTAAVLRPPSPTRGVPPGMPMAVAPASPAPPVEEAGSSTWIIVILIGLLVAIGGAWVALSGKQGAKRAGKAGKD